MHINGIEYRVKKARPIGRGSKGWHLTRIDTLSQSTVYRARGEVSCSCPDHHHRGVLCKHIGALIAAGLISGKGVRRA